MSTHQEHFGRKFYEDKKKGYWISTDYSKENPRVRAHQWVWLNHHGKPPKGYHIHHINSDKSDNRIENLELIHGKRHLSFHMVHHMTNPVNKKIMQERCEKIRPLTKQWHRSEEGRAWHKLHAIRSKFGNGPSFDYQCQECSKSYKSKVKGDGQTRFCCNACKSKWRRKSKCDDIEKICPICDIKYQSSKYSRSKTCSRTCGRKITVK